MKRLRLSLVAALAGGRSLGAIVSALEKASKEIEQTLAESKIEPSMQGFLDEARLRAEIVILRPIS